MQEQGWIEEILHLCLIALRFDNAHTKTSFKLQVPNLTLSSFSINKFKHINVINFAKRHTHTSVEKNAIDLCILETHIPAKL